MNKNIFAKFLLIFALVTTTVFALEKETLKSDMTNKMNQVVKILDNKELNIETKNNEIIKVMDEVFDYSLMSKIALGRNIKKIKDMAQFNEFSKAFENSLKKSYSDKLHLYDNQKLEIGDLAPYKNGRLQLQTKLIGEKETYEINYNFYEDKKTSQWLIYDVELIGVSIIQTYIKQFDGVLANNDINYLISELNK